MKKGYLKKVNFAKNSSYSSASNSPYSSDLNNLMTL